MPSEKALSKLALINVLKKCSPEHRLRMINYLNNDGIRILSEVIFNILFNGSPLTPAQRKKIRKEYSKDKQILKQIGKKSGSIKSKKKLLRQTGGFMGTLLGKNKHILSETKDYFNK